MHAQGTSASDLLQLDIIYTDFYQHQADAGGTIAILHHMGARLSGCTLQESRARVGGALVADIVGALGIQNTRFLRNYKGIEGVLTVYNWGDLHIDHSLFEGTGLSEYTEREEDFARSIQLYHGLLESAPEVRITNSIFWEENLCVPSGDDEASGVLVENAGDRIPVSIDTSIFYKGCPFDVSSFDAEYLQCTNVNDDYPDLCGSIPCLSSPAVDAADPSIATPDWFDLDGDGDTTERLPLDKVGRPRVVGAGPDIGPYEHP